MRRRREAVVLAGGFGTRLAHVVSDVCKPMAPVAGRPFLRYVLDVLADARFSHVVIADGYRREQIETFFKSSYRGMCITYSSEIEPLLTGGAIKQALTLCEEEYVFVLNGDTFCEANFDAMERETNTDNAPTAVLAIKQMHDFDRYGTVEMDENYTIERFNEKHRCEEGFIYAGVCLLRRDALSSMPQVFSFETDWLEMVVDEHILRAVPCVGTFIDIGVSDDYERAQDLLKPFAHGWKLAFFDRDGTINVNTGHLFEPEKLELIPETVELLRRYNDDSEYKVVVVTNQAGIAKGLYTERQMHELHDALDEKLALEGCHIDAYYFCPHHPEITGPCKCRKPAPGMLLAAMHDYDALPQDCVMYGDKEHDCQAALAAGVEFHFAGEAVCV